MDEQKVIESILRFCQSLEGQTLSIDNLSENLHFIRNSKKNAEKYEWLYHCTNAEAFKNILTNREFWLTNLKLVNDKEETDRIDAKEYEKTFFVSCFTYDSNIPEEHWIEYGNMTDGILVGIKREWFERAAVFMCGKDKFEDDNFKIVKNYDEALAYKIIKQKSGSLSNPFFIREFDFYQVVYDDTLNKTINNHSEMNLNGEIINGNNLMPKIAGIIKSTKGKCERFGCEPYEKDWTTEKEVRLKLGIQQIEVKTNGNEIHDNLIYNDFFFQKVAVPITNDAFNEIVIKFSPKFTDKEKYISEIMNVAPQSKIVQI